MKRRKLAAGIIAGAAAVLLLLGVALVLFTGGARGGLAVSLGAVRGNEYQGPPQPQSGLVPTATAAPQATGALTPQEVAGFWEPLQQVAKANNWQLWGLVVDTETDQILLDQNADVGHMPASTTKVPTAAAALDVLPVQDTLRTGTYLEGSDLYLWGEGDLLLNAGASSGETDGLAGLADLAALTADQLTAAGQTTVTLQYQNQIFEGDRRLPAWTTQEVTAFSGDVAPFAIDTGRVAKNEWAFVPDSAALVASTFAGALRGSGITVSNVAPVTAAQVPAAAYADPLAAVESAPMLDQIAFMLRTSDNTLAEQYCHLAADAAGEPTTYPGATAFTISHLAAQGVDTTGMKMDDCSGLSAETRISAEQLVQTLQHSVHRTTGAAELTRTLPRVGLFGTLDYRMSKAPTRGNVTVKSGTLPLSSALTGVLTTDSGQTLVFAVGVQSTVDGAIAARVPVDAFITSLVTGEPTAG